MVRYAHAIKYSASNCWIANRIKEEGPMVADKRKPGWLKGAVILLALLGMLGIFQLQTLFPGNGLGHRVIRVAIEIAAFIVLPIIAWVWHSIGERFPRMRLVRFFVLLVLGLPIIDFWLIPFIFRHPSLANPVSRFLLWAGDWIPILVLVPIAAYSIWRQHRLHS